MITPEYNPTAYRADYWIPLRPQSDGALFLGACKIIVDENMQDIDYIKGYTDMPMLVRTDTLQYLDPRDVVKDYATSRISPSPIRDGAIAQAGADRNGSGGMMVWDLAKNQAVPLHREQVGWHYQQSGIDAGLDRDVSGEAAQWPGSRRDAGLPDVSWCTCRTMIWIPCIRSPGRPRICIVRWARDIGTIKPAAIHNGEGVCHYFHMTEMGRARGVDHDRDRATSASSARAVIPGPATTRPGIWNATPWSGAGLAVHTGEDPFNMTSGCQCARQGNQDQVVLLWRRGRLLEPRRHGVDRQYAEVWAQGVHGQDPHADARASSAGSRT